MTVFSVNLAFAISMRQSSSNSLPFCARLPLILAAVKVKGGKSLKLVVARIGAGSLPKVIKGDEMQRHHNLVEHNSVEKSNG